MDEREPTNDRKRDNYFRCPYCGNLFYQGKEGELLARDSETGAFLCPNGCIKPFIQEPYASSLPE